MGGHYGSIHVRTEDHPSVRAAAEQVAAAMNIRLLLGPALNGWVGLFPEHNGQDDTVSRELARHLPDPLLHLMVHDDDIFAYWLYTGGQLLDSFWSAPGYFGEENRAAEEKMAGNPEAFRPILGDRFARLATLLQRTAGTAPAMESERMEAFARLLKIPNAVTAYEYLQEGDREGIRGWRTFEELPAAAEADERDRARRRSAELKAELKALRANGRLLVQEHRKEVLPRGCHTVAGFLVAWPSFAPGASAFECWAAPWSSPAPVDLPADGPFASFSADATGRRIATNDRGRVRVLDAADDGTWRLAFEVSNTGVHTLSPDGRRVAGLSRTHVTVSDVADGRTVFRHPIRERQRLDFHPSGEWLAIAGDTLALADLSHTPRWLEVYAGGRPPGLTDDLRARLRETFARVTEDELRRRKHAATDALIATMQTSSASWPDRAAADEHLLDMRELLDFETERDIINTMALKEGRNPVFPKHGNEKVSTVGFSRDGRYFWYGSTAGVRVFEWATFPREQGAETPVPLHAFSPPARAEVPEVGWVHAIVEDHDAPAISFCHDEDLYRLDLATGRAARLIRLPGELTAYELHLSPDGAALGVAAQRNPYVALQTGRRRSWADDHRGTWQVWSYPRLRESAQPIEPASAPSKPTR